MFVEPGKTATVASCPKSTSIDETGGVKTPIACEKSAISSKSVCAMPFSKRESLTYVVFAGIKSVMTNSSTAVLPESLPLIDNAVLLQCVDQYLPTYQSP